MEQELWMNRRHNWHNWHRWHGGGHSRWHSWRGIFQHHLSLPGRWHSWHSSGRAIFKQHLSPHDRWHSWHSSRGCISGRWHSSRGGIFKQHLSTLWQVAQPCQPRWFFMFAHSVVPPLFLHLDSCIFFLVAKGGKNNLRQPAVWKQQRVSPRFAPLSR